MRTVVMKNAETGHWARLSDTVQNGKPAIKFEYKDDVDGEVRTIIHENGNLVKMVRDGREHGFEVVSM